jgi:leucyl aminopeptidase (aminopeptidase T)
MTPAWKVARERGARLFSLAGLDAASFVRCVGAVNHRRIFEFGVALRRLIERADTVTVSAANGTDIRMQLGPWRGRRHRIVAPVQRRLSQAARRLARRAGLQGLAERLRTRPPRAFVLDPSGALDAKTRATFLGGQLSFRGIPETIEGTAVIDGFLWPPDEIGQVDEPVVVKFARGRLIDIAGCPIASKILARRFGAETIYVEHFCVGFNPGATFGGRILEAERVFGSMTIGMGQGVLHTDGVIKSPNLIVDRDVVEENGRFLTAQLGFLQNELIRTDVSPAQWTYGSVSDVGKLV